MVISYTLLACDPGSENSVMEQLKAIADVKEAHGIYGPYDILVKVESSSMNDQRETIAFKIREIPHVRSTLTLTCIEGQE
ncbi:MAG: transcriptional regulator, AsnC family [Marine Group I thaumarchaeote]|nr:MAG: transcriptional regulator, AsnC family [Marine Group I thaumarchaeote]